MTRYSNSSFVGRKDVMAIPSVPSGTTQLPVSDPDGMIETSWWTSPTASPSAMSSQTSTTTPSPSLSTIPGAVISHSYASPELPIVTTSYVLSLSPSPSLPTALSSATTLVVTTLPALSTVLQESPSVATTTVAGSGVEVIVVVTTTVAEHLSKTAIALQTTQAGPQYSRPPDLTPGFTAFVVMASLWLGCVLLVIVWCIWQTKRNKPDVGDVEGGAKSPRLPEMVAAGQQLEGGRAGRLWSILNGSEVYGSEPGAGHEQGIQGIGRSTTASNGNSTPRSSPIDAGDRDSSSAGASSYLSAVEYKKLNGQSICSTSSSSYSENDSPLAPLSLNSGQMLINPDTTPTTAVSAINASTAESSCIWENRASGGLNCFVSSCRHPFSGEDTVSPVLVLEHKETGGLGRSFTGPEGLVERRSVPLTTGSLQERLLGKYPARWG